MRNGGAITAVIAVIVVGGCKGQDVEGRVERARQALALRDTRTVTQECKLDFKRVDRTQGAGKELAVICERDLPILSAVILIEHLVSFSQSTGIRVPPDNSLCTEAAEELNKVDEAEPAANAVRARWAELCKPNGTVLEAPDLQTIETDAQCRVVTEAIEGLLASTDQKARELGATADELCHFKVPLRTIERGKDCRSAEVPAAFRLLALHKRLNDPEVIAAIDRWNGACPGNKLEAIAK